ncbi:N-methylhydantoinase A [Devosia enhydra]|uniref:N-methylhydantoinase A n=1 Tax=Devosia enhydra TaxID=665118 RepID=A0A1K2I2J6_9HYPH|nr:hydantoinase/oxoprolinase family protein [Devosia enhydra]SFZ86463.1 N-methylhydantoinase A [Devosia enhydra]
MYRIGIDIGGTFTDCVLVSEATGETRLHKLLTTPADPSDAVLDGVAALLDAGGIGIKDVSTLVHGTTLVTNALIERRGSPTGMLVTSGLRDSLEIARERRYDLFDLRLVFPSPVIRPEARREIAGRLRPDGSEMIGLDEAAIIPAVADLIEKERIEALAICFLNSYANPAHEQRAVQVVTAAFPALKVSASADVFPYVREYERWTTATMNAYVQPLVDRYIARIAGRLGEIGFAGGFHIMTSSGGMVTEATARRYPIRLLESGPAAGALMSAHVGRSQRNASGTTGIANLLSFDMGGTTAKGALVRKGRPLKKYELEVARMHEFKPGSGLPAKAPVIDMIEIGAGGGSIAGIDGRGVVAVGPRSAGASPGPACYGRGGTAPTLTDANLVLGYLDADGFLGGRMRLDRKAAEAAIDRAIAAPLGLDLMRAAWGIHEAINESVASAFRVHASERAFDYRTAAMVAFGGCGPIHAARIARKLNVPRIILPPGAGVMSALGLLRSPFSFEMARSHRVRLDALDRAAYEALFAPMLAEVAAILGEVGIAPEAMQISRKLDMRFAGQGYEIEVEAGATPEGLASAFTAAYRAVFTNILLDEPIEIVNWKIEASGPPPLAHHDFRFASRYAPDAKGPRGRRTGWFPETGATEMAVYDRYRLAPDTAITGPAVVEEDESTTVIGVGDRATIDEHLNLVVIPANAPSASPEAFR